MQKKYSGLALGALLAVGLFRNALADDDDAATKKWLGRWEVIATAVYSTCPNVDQGDAKILQLTVSILKGELRVIELDDAGQSIEYADRSPNPGADLFLFGKNKASTITHEISPSGIGRRVVANQGDDSACAIIYKAKAKRKR
jgi:hypothetical protein